MPTLPDLPGKDLVAGTTKKARAIVVGAGAGALAAGGFVARRLLNRDNGDDGHEPPAFIPPPTEVRATEPKSPKPAKPKAAKPKPKPAKPAKPKAAKPKPAKPAKPTAAKPKPKPAKPKATKPRPAKPKPGTEPGDQRGGKDPHHSLNNPVGEPDETEYPDPYDKREDPRDPVDPDGMPFGAEPHPPTGAESTSEPPPAEDPEVGDRARPPRRDNLDD